MNKTFRGNENLSQKLKPIIIEGASYCIQIEIGTETVKILKFNNIFQSSGQLIIDISDWRDSRAKELENFEKKELYLIHPREESTSFHMIQMTKTLMIVGIWDMDIVFTYLQVNIYNK